MTIAKDHTGRLYPSLAQMARAYGLQPSRLSWRLDAGWDLRAALTTRPQPAERRTTRADRERAASYGVSAARLWDRLARRGWTLERAITTPPGLGRPKLAPHCDHKGRDYPDFHAMCAAYGQLCPTVACRLWRGWTLREALETPAEAKRNEQI